MTTPDPITIAREALKGLRWMASETAPIASEEDACAITAALDYAEKLKAERDEAQLGLEAWRGKAVDARTKNRELTSQLEQAERVMELRWVEREPDRTVSSWDGYLGPIHVVSVDNLHGQGYILIAWGIGMGLPRQDIGTDHLGGDDHAGVRKAIETAKTQASETFHLAFSQWIKDRQEKQALAELHTEEKRLGLDRQAKTDAIGDK